MKKIVALILAMVLCLSVFAGCANNDAGKDGTTAANAGKETTAANAQPLAGTYDIKVWVAEAAVEHTKTWIAKYNETNTDGIVINATIEAVGEGDAATAMTTDVEAGADLYCFAQDQAARLIQAGALAKLGVAAAETVTSSNDAGVVSAAKSGDELWAYPLTADNGYFLYYDKSVVKEESVDSLEAIIADCEAAGKMFSYELEGSAWYTASFFFATGCHSVWTTDNDGAFISVDDNFNSEAGLIAAKGMQKLLTSTCYNNSSAAEVFAAAIPSAALVSGTWALKDIQAILGDNMGVADLPSFTVDGQTYHLGSYSGSKLMGVKPQTDAVRAAALHKLAQYLTSEEVQLDRFVSLGWGPANLNAQQDPAVTADPSLVALAAQGAYAVPQGQIHGSWWDIAKVIATNVKAAADEEGLKAALTTYQTAMDGLFNMSDEVKNAFTVIGSINGDGWTVDLPMTKQDDGTWKTDEAYTMDAGVEFKVRQGKSWDVAFPADNFVVETAGTYYVVFDPATETVSLVAAG